MNSGEMTADCPILPELLPQFTRVRKLASEGSEKVRYIVVHVQKKPAFPYEKNRYC